MGRIRSSVWIGALAICAAVVAGCTSGSGVITQTTGSSPTSAASSTGPSSVTSSPLPSTPPSSTVASTPPPTTPNPWPADLSPDQVISAQAALASVTGLLEVSATANADPGARDWTADVRKYAADPAAAQTLDALATVAKANVRQTVPPVYEHLTVISVNDQRTVIEACADDSARTVVDSTGESVLQPPTNPRTIVTFTLRLYPADQGGWLVGEETDSSPPRTC